MTMMQWIVKDVVKDGIFVDSIALGACETEMTKGFDYNVSMLSIPRMGKPEEMAEAIVFIVSDASN